VTTNIEQTIESLAGDVVEKRQSLDDGLFALQTWFDQHVKLLGDEERVAFSERLNAEKDSAKREGQPHGDDLSLVSSVLRLHAMRLLYRYDETARPKTDVPADSPYQRGHYRFQNALREAELATNEARVDTAIANAHMILEDVSANRRWLQDAIMHLETASQKDLIRLAEAIPLPEKIQLNILQRASFALLGIKQEEIGRRNLQSLRQVAHLQTKQLAEMAQLLAASFKSIEDSAGWEQAMQILTKFDRDIPEDNNEVLRN